MMPIKSILIATALVAAIIGCASTPSNEETNAKAAAMLKTSFKANRT